jgi:hypothetical protein
VLMAAGQAPQGELGRDWTAGRSDATGRRCRSALECSDGAASRAAQPAR